MRLLSIAAGTILDVDPAAAVDVAFAAGFPAVGIWFDPSTWTASVASTVRSRLDATGVIALDVEPIMLAPTDGPPDHGERIIDAALSIGARNVLVASRDSDRARVASRLHALASRVGGADVRIVLEFLPVLAIKTLPDALSVVKAAAHPALGVLIDSLHLSRAGHVPDDLREVDPCLLPYVQLCDAPFTPADTSLPTLLHEALHGRLLPGDGGLPIRELLDIVANVPVSMELRSESLRSTYPDPVDRARALYAATVPYLRDVAV